MIGVLIVAYCVLRTRQLRKLVHITLNRRVGDFAVNDAENKQSGKLTADERTIRTVE